MDGTSTSKFKTVISINDGSPPHLPLSSTTLAPTTSSSMSDELAATTSALRLHDYLFLLPITFLYWDHLMTFGDEVRFLWRKTKTPSTYCFFVNRYLACFGDIVVAVFIFASVPDSTTLLFISGHDLTGLVKVMICVLLTLRIYALYGRYSKVWMGMVVAAFGLLVASLWAISGQGGTPVPNVQGCHIANSQSLGIHLAVPWEALFLYDLMIGVALFFKSFQMRHKVTMHDSSLLNVLSRDGAIYFVAMALANLANILTFFMAGPLLRGCLSTLASCLSVTMMSRLMLNLHAVEIKGIFSTTAHIKYSGTSASEDFQREVELDTLWTRDFEQSAFAPNESRGSLETSQ
ncbi:hypothetical protein B0H17DRAFT_1063763 [Mycena rosella]|uniref:DUF6533 domain-containing protein n=1 Tax=Mycena rosella TaxID=1033263 RepID=A0AAD7DG64_MYCRO|nr:hypothetical protein B0H17DRAFT_1063763 [Mycena rosella]